MASSDSQQNDHTCTSKEDLLNCSKCKKPYDDHLHQAKYLPRCHHTYCATCLGNLPDAESNCPSCNCVLGGTVDSLPNNFLVEHERSIQEYRNSLKNSCGSCTNEQAVSYCGKCKCYLCQACVNAHKQLGPLAQQGHKLITIAEHKRSGAWNYLKYYLKSKL